MNNKQINEKALFVVGLLATFLAFSSYKETLIFIKLDIGGHGVSLWSLMTSFVIFLALTVYFYALDYLRYSFGKYQNFFLFRGIIPIANFFYSVAILSPILVIFFWIASDPYIFGFLSKYKHAAEIFDVIGIIAIAIGSIFNSRVLSREAKLKEAEAMDELKNGFLQRASQLYQNDFFAETIFESQKALELYLRERLLSDRDIYTRNIKLSDLFNLAQKNNLVDEKTLVKLKMLRQQRNAIAHSQINATKEEAFSALNLVRDVLGG